MFFKKGQRWDLETDLLVIGSGGAGLTGAIVAHDRGAKVLVLEKSGKVGGTTAVSGGVLWIPNNHHMPEVDIDDSREDALTYMKRLSDGRSDEALIEAYIDTAPQMIRYLEDKTPLQFSSLKRYPDYHPEFEGGRPGGRSLDPGLFNTHELGEWADRLRRSPVFGPVPMTVGEATDWGVFSKPLSLPYAKLAQRYKDGLVCYGGALMGPLLAACLERGIEPRLETPAHSLVVEDGRVLGAEAESPGGSLRIKARKGVLLASGGFEWNKEICAAFLGGPLTHPNSPPFNDGDGLKMAMGVGAKLANMNEAWWCPSVVIPGEEYEQRQLNRGDFAIRSMPHSIMVNRKGQRFVNEAHNYNDMAKAFSVFDPVDYERTNLPCWLVFDQNYLEKYALITVVPGMPAPEWISTAPTLEALADQLGIDPVGLKGSVERFNQFARDGVDQDFRRGESLYDHFYGDPEHQPNPNLGVIEKGPFFALEVHPGAIGTKGGPVVNSNAQVLNISNEVVEGLYAAGNVMAGITGPGYPGAGSTIGTAMTWGYIAGLHLTQSGSD